MRKNLRLGSALLAMFVLPAFAVPPCFAQEGLVESVQAKVTTNDPEFLPLEGEKAIGKKLPWYVYVLGVAVVAGAAAAAGGGGGGGGDSTPTTGSVTGSW